MLGKIRFGDDVILGQCTHVKHFEDTGNQNQAQNLTIYLQQMKFKMNFEVWFLF